MLYNFGDVAVAAAKCVLEIGGLGGPALDEMVIPAGDDKAGREVEKSGEDGRVVAAEALQTAK